MAEKQAAPPAYPVVDMNSGDKKWQRGLVFYAGAMTATVVCLAVLGGLYVNKMDNLNPPAPVCPPERTEDNHERENYQAAGKNGIKSETELDRTDEKEISRMTDPNYANSSTVVVIDHKKELTGIYNPRSDECYLIPGIYREMPTSQDMVSTRDSKDESPMGSGGTRKNLKILRHRPVRDYSLVPKELYSLCWGKNVFWAELTDPTTEVGEPGHRGKRQVINTICDCAMYCDYSCWFSICFDTLSGTYVICEPYFCYCYNCSDDSNRCDATPPPFLCDFGGC